MTSTGHPVFFKQIPLVINCKGIFVLVDLATGFSKPVDPLSGMTVNLMKILEWQQAFRDSLGKSSFPTWLEFLVKVHQYFQNQAKFESAICEAVQVRFFDRSILRSQKNAVTFERANVVVDVQNELRILKSTWTVKDETQLERLQALQIPSKLTFSFEHLAVTSSIFQNQEPIRLEFQDPQSLTSEVFI